MKRSRVNIAAVLLAAGLSLPAGAARAQTPFVLRSVGQSLPEGDARMLGRGGWGLTVADSLDPGFKNPASIAWVQHVTLGLTVYSEAVSSESPVAKRSTYRTYMPDIRLAVPVRKGRLALTGGYKLERATQWQTKVDSTWTVWGETLRGNEQFERSGSTFKVPLGASWRVFPALAVAGAVNLERGQLRETLADYFISPVFATGVPYYRSVLAVTTDEFTGTSTTVAGLFTPLRDVRLGVTWTTGHTLDVTRKTETGGVADRVYNEFEITRPAELAVGLSLPLGGRWELGADARRQDWRAMVAPENWLAEPGWQDQLVEEVQVGVGLERRRANVRRAGASNLPFRLGANWHRWPYRIAGQEIIERSLSVGTGFPLRGEAGHLDLALTYGQIGDQADNGLESSFLRLAVSVKGIESWW